MAITSSRVLFSLCLAAGGVASGEDLLLSDFNGSGFGGTFGGFQAQAGPTSTRLYDPNDGWGGASRNASLDLSGLSDGRLVVDFTPNANHQADFFLVQLNDADGLSGRWTFNTGGLPRGEAVRLSSMTTIAEPGAVYDGSGFVETPPDLSRITQWAIEGQWASTAPFDITFDNLSISTTAPPPPPYPGYEADAPWRAEASARIDAVRKADLNVRVVDAAGNPVAGAVVSVQQQAHEFGFGSAVQARRLRDSNPQHATYRQKVAELFNIATIENNLKWPAWDGEWGSNYSRSGALAASDWLADRGIDQRGHVLVWPGVGNLPNQPERRLVERGSLSTSEQQQVRDWIADHITDIAGAMGDRIKYWDAINEPRANHDVMDVLPEGDGAMASWLEQAHAAAPGAKLYLNEYGILASGGGTNTANQQLLESQVRALQQAGAPLHGVGLQSHFDLGNLTGPEQLWAIVDRYAALGVDVQVTEFDVDVADEQLQAAYLRDFYTAMFAHEAVDDILMWGFWEEAVYMRNRAIFRSDWSPKPAAEAYVDLVFGEWWTDEDGAADGNGELGLRAFRGEQRVTAAFAGESSASDVILGKDGAEITITLSMIQGDFNRDGVVDAADYTVWRDTLGDEVAPGEGADGDADGRITRADLRVWDAFFGSSASGASPVPEPAGFATFASLGAVLSVLFLGR